jgi:sugar phosphate isomerase/epimerase
MRTPVAYSQGSSVPKFPILKGAFPFRLGTTSYILPDEILPNVRVLGPYLDEVELVLFESGAEENLPSPREIRELSQVARDLRLTYNVHLPSDLYLGARDPAVRGHACETTCRFYERTLPLNPMAYILHLDLREADGRADPDLEGWLARSGDSLGRLVERGMVPGRVAVENLSYPLGWIEPMVDEMGMSYCLDVGHMLRYGVDMIQHLHAYLPRTSMIHLHGVCNGTDHRGLEWIPSREWEAVCGALEGFDGGVSVEVFSEADLRSSLERMAGGRK